MATGTRANVEAIPHGLADVLPEELRNIGKSQTAIPRIAKDSKLTAKIEAALKGSVIYLL